MDLSSLILETSTLVVAVGGVTLAMRELRQGNRQQRLELGNLYIQRYWQIDDDMLRLPKGSQEHTHSRHRYLRLCEDEFEAARNGWLDDAQWAVWHSWLTRENGQWQLKSDLDACDLSAAGFEHVRNCLEGGVEHSWDECRANRSVNDL